MRQNKRSLVNGHHMPYLTNQTNAIMMTALKEREQIDKFGYDSRVSNFQLLLKEIARRAKDGLIQQQLLMMGSMWTNFEEMKERREAEKMGESGGTLDDENLEYAEAGLYIVD